MADETNHSINVTIWGQLAKDPRFKRGVILAVKGAKVSNFGGKSLNISEQTFVEFNPNETKAEMIRKWFNAEHNNQKTYQLTEFSGGPSSSPDGIPKILFGEMLKTVQENEGFMSGARVEPLNFKVQGIVLKILSERTMIYSACAYCRKKVMQDHGGWFCEKCQKVSTDCKYTYNFSVLIGDFTSSVLAQVMGPEVGDQILGMPAASLKEIVEN